MKERNGVGKPQSNTATDVKKGLGPALLQVFEKLPPSHQRRWLTHVDEAKSPEARSRRIEKLREAMQEPQKR